jgi:L-threonylcarbamoyladenylate synthase
VARRRGGEPTLSLIIDCGSQPCAERERGLVAAAAAVRRGECVVLPTEFMYGLAADAFHPRGIARLRDAKGRGDDLPVPVLVASARMAEGIVAALTPVARSLMEAFWPGPLTLVAAQQPTLSWSLAAPSVSVRMPVHPLALALLDRTGPLAVTGAQRAGAAPARTCEHARAQLGDDVAVYLDAGPARAESPSAVVDITGEIPVLLRPGGYPVEVLREVCPDLSDETTEPA